MGLDAVELILEVEERFAVAIDDDEASSIRTVGDLRDLVAAKLRPAVSRECLTSHVFYRLRSTLSRELGVPRGAITPSSETAALVPRSGRRRQWRALSDRLTWELPQLKLPDWLIALLLGVAIAMILYAIVGGQLGHLSSPAAWALGLAAVPYLWIAFKITVPFEVHIPSEGRTVRQLTREVLRLNFQQISRDRQAWNSQDIWRVLQSIVVQQLGVEETAVTPDARLVEDLEVA